MKWFLFLLLFAIAAAFLGIVHIQYPGFISITWLGYEIRFSIILGIILFIFFVFLLFLLFHGFSWLLGLPQKWAASYHQSQEKKAKHELLDLLITYEAETFPSALQHQKKAEKALSQNPFFLWLSGNTFEKAQKSFEAEKCFMALKEKPESLFLGLKGQIKAAFERKDNKGAYELLKLAEERVPASPWVLKQLLELSREDKKYKEAQALVLRLEDLSYLSPEQAKKEMASLQYKEALETHLSAQEKEVLLRQAHYLNPSLRDATLLLAPLLQDHGHSSYALTVLESTWKAAPDQAIGDLYLKIVSPKSTAETYKAAIKFTQKTANTPESLLFLARIALQGRLWGEARAHLEELLKSNKTLKVDAYELLANLELEQHKDWKAALEWLQKGLKASQRA